MRTAIFFTLLTLASCGGSSSGGSGGSSSSSSIIPMISNLNCSGSSCLSSSLLKNDASAVFGWGADFYGEVNDTIIPDIKTTLDEINQVLKQVNFTTCESIPSSGSVTVDYEGIDITITARSSSSINLFSKGVLTTKSIEVSDEANDVFLEAEFNCSAPRVAYIKADLTILDPTKFEKFAVYFYENGDEKLLNLFEHYQGASSREGYMVMFETNGTDFEAYFGYDADITGAGENIILAAKSDSTNGARIVADAGGAINFSTDTDAAVAGGSSSNQHHYCYSTSYVAEACAAGHPSLGNLGASSIREINSDDITERDFNMAKVTTLNFTFP